MELPTLTTLAVTCLATVPLLLLLLSNHLRRRNLHPPPGPKPWPIIGNLNLIGPLPHRSIHDLSLKHGPILQLQFGSIPVLVASSTDMAKLFLKTMDVTFAGRPKTAAGRYTTYNYSDITWSPYGAYWRQARKMCLTELFSAKRLECYEYIRIQELNSLIVKLFKSSGKPIMLKDQLSTVNLNVISRMVLGKTYSDESDMLAGGTESSAVTVEWAISELLKKPDLFTKATEELDRVIGHSRWVTEKDITNLPFIQSIVKETMRMHPVSPLLVPRLAREDCKVAGYDVKKDTVVLVNVWSIGRDPRLWDEPEEFWPERFVGRDIDVKGQNFELLPFGSGRRMCPGYGLGLKVIEATLANLLHGYKWRLKGNMGSDELNMEEVFGLSTPRKVPLEVVVEPRLDPHIYSL